MNRIFNFRCVLSASLCLLIFACKPAADKKDEKPADEKSTNAEAGLKIEAETQAKMGLKTEVVTGSEFAPETKCFGHVIDPALLNAAVNEIALAKASLSQSQKELDRLKVLRKQNNASDRAVETAQTAVEKDHLTIQAATEKLQLAWGVGISGRSDLAELAQGLATGKRSLVRVDVPIEERPVSIPQRLRISLSANAEGFDTEFLGSASTVDLSTQGHGLLFLANVGSDKLPVNSVVMGTIPSGTAPVKGVRIPAAAVIVHDGEKWVYLQSGDSQFHRELLVNPMSNDKGYFVTNGVEAGAHIVTTGAQQLLSEELKSQIAPD